MCAESRMSTGSTQSCFSMSSTRVSALTAASRRCTRSTRVRRANSMRSATLPSLERPATESGERSSTRSSNRPISVMSLPAPLADRLDQRLGILAAADDHGAALEPALGGPLPDQCAQREAEDDERDGAARIPAHEPDARHLVGRLEQEGDEQQRDERHRPCRERAADLADDGAIGRDAMGARRVERDVGERAPRP